jgi:protein-tyrosine phosphatase
VRYTRHPRVSFVDLHSHVLFGIDDGAPDERAARDLLRGLAAVGFTEVCATPHQKAGQYLPDLSVIRERFASVSAWDGMPALRLAAENMWDDVFFERWQTGAIPSYDGGPAFLVEIQTNQLPPGFTEHLFKMRLAGRLPVLAHPERYAPLWEDDALVERLRGTCALVVDLGAVAGAHGRMEAKVARRFVEAGVAHAVASDAHAVSDLKLAAQGIAWIRKRCGEQAVTRLLADAPRRILAGEIPD